MKHTLYKGDCLEKMKDIPDGSVDMILTDPPYQCTSCSWDVALDMSLVWPEIERIMRTKGTVLLHGNEPFSSFIRVGNVENYKYDWIWDKKKPSNFPLAKKQPMKYHENIMVFYSGVYYPVMVPVPGRKAKKGVNENPTVFNGGLNRPDYLDKVYTDKYPSTILEFSNADQTNRFHPTQKPVALLEYLIKTYTLENETVLDFTMGSGSTGVACKNLNRNFIGIEKDDKYFEIAKNRIEE
jgi:DNA modification methylase